MTPVPTGLLEAFDAFERALMTDDLAALDRMTAPWSDTVAVDASGVAVGGDEVLARRRARGPATQRRLLATHVQVVADGRALVVAEFEQTSGRRGVQTQLWQKGVEGWEVSATHVMLQPPAFDRRIWRVVGDPLVLPTAEGPLDGVQVAVQDLFAVAGQAIGAGNPTWRATSPLEQQHAPVVERLLAAGASVAGLARCDELGWTADGRSPHHGATPNPRSGFRVAGGASAGAAAAVAAGHADVGLGIDSAGGVRVPAAYQGLWAIRTTQDAVSRDGSVPLAPTFDAVGWVARDAAALAAVGRVLLPEAGAAIADVVAVDSVLELADDEVRAVLGTAVGRIGRWEVDLVTPDQWLQAFHALQQVERHRTFGPFVAEHGEHVGEVAAERARLAASIDDVWASRAREQMANARERLRKAMADRVVVLPTTPTVAPRLDDPGTGALRQTTTRLTCLAEIGGLPVVSVPLSTDAGVPVGLSLMGPPDSDALLLELASSLA